MRMFLFLLFCACVQGIPAHAQPLRIAVAANAQGVTRRLLDDFSATTGISGEITSGSSGKLTAQIKNGAPFDLFLSADMTFPEELFRSGFAISPPVEYARGSLIVCLTGTGNARDWLTLLQHNSTQKIAIGNPQLAPYGKAAEETLRSYGQWEAVQPYLVLGESIAQVNTYIRTGVVMMGFTTESLLYEAPDAARLRWVRIDPKRYRPIRQGVVLLQRSKLRKDDAATRFYAYLSSAAARNLLKKNGYRLP